MINTTLPYDFNAIDNIAKNGAIVDMSLCKFNEDIEKNAKTSLVYLKNTGFKNVQLDFSNANTQFKFCMIKQYVQSCQEFYCNEIVMTWKSIIAKHVNFKDIVYECILNEDEIDEFMKLNICLVSSICKVMKSLPLFLIKKLKTADNMQFATDNVTVFCNISNLVDNDLLIHICEKYNCQAQDYALMFNDNSMELFNKIVKTDFGFILAMASHLRSYQ